MISMEDEDLECLRMLEKEEFEGERRYYVYDAADGSWWFVGTAHSPTSLLRGSKPPEFASLKRELWGAAKRVLVHKLRKAMDPIEKALLDWSWR